MKKKLIILSALVICLIGNVTYSQGSVSEAKALAKELARTQAGLSNTNPAEIAYKMMEMGVTDIQPEAHILTPCPKKQYLDPMTIDGVTYRNKTKCYIVKFKYNGQRYNSGGCM